MSNLIDMEKYGMNGPSWLDIAKEVTLDVRQIDYGHPVINFLRTAIKWTVRLKLKGKLAHDKVLTPSDVVWMMVDLKDAREIERHKEDSGIDTIGYLSCWNRIDAVLRGSGLVDGGLEALESFTLEQLFDLCDKFISMEADGDKFTYDLTASEINAITDRVNKLITGMPFPPSDLLNKKLESLRVAHGKMRHYPDKASMSAVYILLDEIETVLFNKDNHNEQLAASSD